MEHAICHLDATAFDKAVHGGLDDKPVLKEGNDLCIFVKPKATVQGNAAAVITFTVQLPDGSLGRAQVVTTAATLEMIAGCIAGWKARGDIT